MHLSISFKNLIKFEKKAEKSSIKETRKWWMTDTIPFQIWSDEYLSKYVNHLDNCAYILLHFAISNNICFQLFGSYY